MFNKIISIFLLTILIAANASLTLAQEPETIDDFLNILVPTEEDLFEDSDNLENGEVNFASGDLEQEIAPSLLRIVVQFSAVAALLGFTYLGIRLILFRDNEDELKKTKNAFIMSVIGAIIIAGSFAVVIGILRIFDNIGK